jgi:hypothetical protein
MKFSNYVTATVLLTVVSPIMAVPMPPIPTEPIYFEPPVVEATAQIRQQSCIQIDNNIRYLQPYKYTYKPDYYQDGSNKFATAMITMDFLPILGEYFGFAYLGYSALVDEKENRRILQVKQQISMLQRVKAEKHCFE